MFRMGWKAENVGPLQRTKNFDNSSFISLNLNVNNFDTFSNISPNNSRMNANNVIHEFKRRVSFRNPEMKDLSRISSNKVTPRKNCNLPIYPVCEASNESPGKLSSKKPKRSKKKRHCGQGPDEKLLNQSC